MDVTKRKRGRPKKHQHDNTHTMGGLGSLFDGLREDYGLEPLPELLRKKVAEIKARRNDKEDD